MIFCEKCGAMLLPNKESKKKINCRCGHIMEIKENLIFTEKGDQTKKIEVVDNIVETLPKTKMDCPKCGHDEAYYWGIQTRAGDEAETQFFKCAKCKHQWRSYQ